MLCDFCQEDIKQDFLGREKIDDGELVFLCLSCKIKIRKLNSEVKE